MATAKTFNDLIRPYFTPCYRAHMLKISRPLDLWDPDAVKTNWQLIFDAVESGFMPMSGCGEGVFDTQTKAQFLSDFQGWKDTGFPQS